MERVATLVGELAENRDFFERYPETLYFEARSAMVRGDYDRATWIMVDYVSVAPLPPTPGVEDQPPAETTEPEAS